MVGKGDRATAPAQRRQPVAPPAKIGKVTGKYASLHTYLANRYAETVVLTFTQIEDLLGFALPDTARSRLEWWTTDVHPDSPPCSDAWTLAGRSARANIMARTVTFERLPAAR